LKAIRYVLLGDTLNAFLLPRVFWICANLVWIRIRGSIPLTKESWSGREYLFRTDSAALLNLLENSLGRSKPATRLMQAQ
jgi:hypothetical protein